MKKFLFLMLVLLSHFGVKAQETILTTSQNVTGSNGTVFYSVGQMFYNTNSGINGSVSQGIQQPYEISMKTSTENMNVIDINCSIYPNPTSNNLILEFYDYEDMRKSYELYDFQGKLIDSKEITKNISDLNMINLSAATYFLKIIIHQKVIKTFKIIKN